MDRDNTRPISRRTFTKHSLLSTGAAIVTASSAAGARRESDEGQAHEIDTDPDSNAPPVERAVMFPYQFLSGRQFTVVEDGLDWRPSGLSSAYQTHVISYTRSPSFRAFLFTETDEPLDPQRSFTADGIRGTLPVTGRRLVTVGIDTNEATDSDTR